MSATLRLFTDFVCPYCYIAEHSTIERLEREYDVTVEWRGFELHPETPRGGMSLQKLFGPRVTQMHDQLRQFAAGFGITEMKLTEHLPNTRRALAVAELARDAGLVNAWKKAAMHAHWKEGRDLEDEAVLRDLATKVGLDPDRAAAAMDDAALLARVDATREEANAIGVSGIPTVVIDRFGVVGCQPYEAFERLLARAGVAKRVQA